MYKAMLNPDSSHNNQSHPGFSTSSVFHSLSQIFAHTRIGAWKPVEFQSEAMTDKKSTNLLSHGLAAVVHILVIVPTIYTLYISVIRGNSLATWHVVFFTLGCCVFMVEGTFAVSGDAFLVSRVSRAGRIRIHWILHLLGVVMIAAGMIVVVILKEQLSIAHIISDHAIWGLTGVILTCLANVNGVMTLYPKSFFGIMGLGPVKILHSVIGILATILMFAGQITGLETGWWAGTHIAWVLTVTAYIVGLFLVFVKPVMTTGGRIRQLFDNSS